MSDDVPRISDLEARRLMAMAVLAPLLVVPALLSHCPARELPPPAPLVVAAAETSSLSASQRLLLGEPLDLNTATASDLTLLPGIGDKLAARIVSERTLHGPFTSLDDLDQIEGIGPRLIASLPPRAAVRTIAPTALDGSVHHSRLKGPRR